MEGETQQMHENIIYDGNEGFGFTEEHHHIFSMEHGGTIEQLASDLFGSHGCF